MEPLAQQTLGGITGVVTDAQGGSLAGASVTVVGEQTGLKREQATGANGYYEFVNLPIGHYTLTFTHDGFQAQSFPGIAVQADRTATVNATLAVGAVSETVTVNASAADECCGYDERLRDGQGADRVVPLPTGSFTGVAILRRA